MSTCRVSEAGGRDGRLRTFDVTAAVVSTRGGALTPVVAMPPEAVVDIPAAGTSSWTSRLRSNEVCISAGIVVGIVTVLGLAVALL